MNRHVKIALVIALLGTAACSPPISGIYSDQKGLTTYEFNRNGRAVISVLGTNVAAEYQIDGDKILVTSPQGTVVLTRKGQQLFGPMGLELVRQNDQ